MIYDTINRYVTKFSGGPRQYLPYLRQAFSDNVLYYRQNIYANVLVINTHTGTSFVVIYCNCVCHRNATLAKHTLILLVLVRHSFIYSIRVVLGIFLFDSSSSISVYEYAI